MTVSERIASAVFDSRDEADRALSELRSAGISDSAISIVDPNDWAQGRTYDDDDGAHDAKSDVAKGAVIGTGAGALLGIAALAIPGVGPLAAAGAIAASAIPQAAAIGAGAGLAAGSVAGLLAGPTKQAFPSSRRAKSSPAMAGTARAVRVRPRRKVRRENSVTGINPHDVGQR